MSRMSAREGSLNDTCVSSELAIISTKMLGEVEDANFAARNKTDQIRGEDNVSTVLAQPSSDATDTVSIGCRVVESGKRVQQHILDGFLLLEAAHVEFPDLATKAKLNDKALCDVLEEDLPYYHRLSYLDVGENRLDICQLTSLSGLEELRIQCNEIAYISEWRTAVPFPSLLVLDLSFNHLSIESVAMLAELPRLRELDLTCNDLEVIPDNMSLFTSLEILVLAQNQLGLEDCIRHLSQAPNLRELDCSDNQFTSIPQDIDFPRLTWFNLVNNLVSRQNDVEALLGAPELTQVLLYGNPITQNRRTNTKRSTSTGESNVAVASHASMGLIPDGFHAASCAPEEASPEVINVVTDAPSVRVGQKKTKAGGKSRGMYAHFQITQVADLTIRKPSEWRAKGNKMLFASLSNSEAREEGKEPENQGQDEDVCTSEDEDDSECEYMGGLGPGAWPDQGESKENTDECEDGEAPVSCDDKSGAGASIFMTEPSLFDNEYGNNNKEEKEETDSLANYLKIEEKQESELPLDIKLETMTDTKLLRQALAQYGASLEEENCPSTKSKSKPSAAKLQNATSALRHALKHPLTAHVNLDFGPREDELVPNMKGGHGYLDPASSAKQFTSSFARFEKSTTVSKLKQKPKINKGRPDIAKVSKRARAPPSIRSPGEKRERALLSSIESVLDRMDFNVSTGENLYEMHNSGHQNETERSVSNLTGLVNNVMNQYEL